MVFPSTKADMILLEFTDFIQGSAKLIVGGIVSPGKYHGGFRQATGSIMSRAKAAKYMERKFTGTQEKCPLKSNLNLKCMEIWLLGIFQFVQKFF